MKHPTKYLSPDQLLARIKAIKAQNHQAKIVFTNGCFDIIHIGHIHLLYEAKALGHYLIVAINSDRSVQKLKGPNRPINQESDRIQVLSALEMIDCVTTFKEETPINLIKILQPSIHVKGGDYTKESLPEYATISDYGGQIKIIPFLPGKSSTTILSKLEDPSR